MDDGTKVQAGAGRIISSGIRTVVRACGGGRYGKRYAANLSLRVLYMSYRYKGKYVKIDPKYPNGVGVCDESGLVFNRKDLRKQLEWRGDRLVWTGSMRGEPYLDVPSEQNRPPIVKRDPIAVDNPRPPEGYTDPESNPVLPYDRLIQKLRNMHWGR